MGLHGVSKAQEIFPVLNENKNKKSNMLLSDCCQGKMGFLIFTFLAPYVFLSFETFLLIPYTPTQKITILADEKCLDGTWV